MAVKTRITRQAALAKTFGRILRKWGLWALFAVILYRVPFSISNDYQLRVVTLALIYAGFATSLELVMGRAGQVSLGHGGFFAIGAYGEGILQTHYHAAPWPALIVTVLIGAASGLVVGATTLRVRGPYLAVVTIGFGLTVQALLYVFSGLTDGAVGIAGIHYMSSIGLGGGALGSYYAAALVLLLSLVIAVVLTWGNTGLALRAVCDSLTLSSASGVNVRLTKLLIFSASAAMAAACGAVFGSMGYISPETFSIQLSIFPVVAVVLGGIGTVSGPVLGAFLLYGFSQLTSRAAQASAIMYGVLLMAMPLLLPNGITGLVRAAWEALERRRAWGSSTPGQLSAPRGEVTSDKGIVAAGEPVGLEIIGVSLRFGSVRAVDDVSIHAAAGEVLGLVGPNGSGKSTLLNIASGYYSADSGSVLLGGVDVTSSPLYRRVRRGMLPAFQTAQLMDTRSIRENLAVGRVALSRWGRTASPALVNEIAAALQIDIPLTTSAGGLPEGTRKIVEIGRTLLSSPKVLLLDEPTSGLSLEEVEKVVQILATVGDSGVTVILADHNFEFVGRVCKRLVVLEGGRILAEGTADELRRDEAVVRAYLGRETRDGHAADALSK